MEFLDSWLRGNEWDKKFSLWFYFIYFFFLISWRLITLQCCSSFCHTLTRIIHGFFFFFLIFLNFFIFIYFFFVVNFVIHWNETSLSLHVFPIPIPPPTSLSTRYLQVLPEHQVRALVSCIQPGLVICFTLDSIHVSVLFSWNIPPSPSPTESKWLFYKSVSLFLFCI